MMRKWLIALILLSGLAGWAQDGALRYPQDIAGRLVERGDVQKVTGCKQRLRDTSKDNPPLLVVSGPPLEGIPVAPESNQRTVAPPVQWTLPPFAAVNPALPRELPEEVRAQLAAADEEPEATPDVWSSLTPDTAKPSALLRPRVVTAAERLIPRDFETPRAFSQARYSEGGEEFFEISVFGGTTSFRAEDAFMALRAAAPDRERIEGIGVDAFLTHLEIAAPEPTETTPAPPQPDPNAKPFDEIPTLGPARPDLLDPGRVDAASAPAFQSIPTTLEANRVKLSAPAPKPEVKAETVPAQEISILVAYFPDQAVTVQLAVDRRVGTFQNLVNLALQTQRKLTTKEW
ncbi:MAG: hypothetical protein KC910_29720 [Candidatus Eremiobacteraeota bacterium]|nr:hypothetical protein [Candidatus Eremiobacteraeota bacterium]